MKKTIKIIWLLLSVAMYEGKASQPNEKIQQSYYSSLVSTLRSGSLFKSSPAAKEKTILKLMQKAYKAGNKDSFNEALKKVIEDIGGNRNYLGLSHFALIKKVLADAYSTPVLADQLDPVVKIFLQYTRENPFANWMLDAYNKLVEYQKIITGINKTLTTDSLHDLQTTMQEVKTNTSSGDTTYFDIFHNYVTSKYLQGTDDNRRVLQQFFAQDEEGAIKKMGYDLLRQFYAKQKSVSVEDAFKAFKDDTYLDSIAQGSGVQNLLTDILKKSPKTPVDYAIQANAFIRLFNKIKNPRDFQKLSVKRIQEIASYLAYQDPTRCEQLRNEFNTTLQGRLPVDEGLTNALQEAFTKGANKGYKKSGKTSPSQEEIEKLPSLVLKSSDNKVGIKALEDVLEGVYNPVISGSSPTSFHTPSSNLPQDPDRTDNKKPKTAQELEEERQEQEKQKAEEAAKKAAEEAQLLRGEITSVETRE